MRALYILQIIRSDPVGRKRCTESMDKAGKLAAQLGEPYISRCHAGLIGVFSTHFV